MGWDDDPIVEDFGENDEIVGSPKKSDPSFWDQHPDLRSALQIGLPTALAVGGELAAAPFTGGMSGLAALGTLAGAAGVGSLGGEAINQATGVNKPDPNALGMAFGTGAIGRPLGGVISWMGKTLIPGLSEGIRAAITPEMRELPGKLLLGDKSSKVLYDTFKQQNLQNKITNFPTLTKAVQDIGDEISKTPWENLRKAAHAEGMEGLFQQISGSIGKGGQGLTFEEAEAAQKVLGKLSRSTSDPVQRGQYQQVHKALLTDMENAPMPSSGPLDAWKAARNAAKREHAHLDLSKATESAIGVKEGVDIIDPNKIVKWLKSDAGKESIQKRVGPQEYRQIMNEYRYWASQSGLPTGKATGAAIGSVIGTMAGGMPGGVGGAPAGWIAAQEISKAMLSEGGRRMARKFIGHPSQSNFRRMMAATGTAVGQMGIHAGEDEEE